MAIFVWNIFQGYKLWADLAEKEFHNFKTFSNIYLLNKYFGVLEWDHEYILIVSLTWIYSKKYMGRAWGL